MSQGSIVANIVKEIKKRKAALAFQNVIKVIDISLLIILVLLLTFTYQIAIYHLFYFYLFLFDKDRIILKMS